MIGDLVWSGTSELGFGYRVSALGLGYDFGSTRFLTPSVFIGYEADPTYPEAPFYEPKIPMLANVEFVYSCRNSEDCSPYLSLPTVSPSFTEAYNNFPLCGCLVKNFISCYGNTTSETFYDNINIYAIFNPSTYNQYYRLLGTLIIIPPLSDKSKVLVFTVSNSRINTISTYIQNNFQYGTYSDPFTVDLYLHKYGTNDLDVFIHPSDQD
jgi:hypothetical protein